MFDGDILVDLPVFVAVADAGSFATAASRLGVTRSAVSRTIGRLERRLGIRLFHRTTRMLMLTDDGQAFLEHCRRTLHDLQATVAMLASGQREATGRLRVSMPVAFGRLCVSPTLIELAAAHPNMELDLNFNDRLVDILGDGFELAIRNGPLPDLPGLTCKHVVRQRMSICAAPSYLDVEGTPELLDDVMKHRAVLYGRPGRTHPWLIPQPDGGIEAVTPHSRMRFDDVGTIRDAVLAGNGLAWLPNWLIYNDILAGSIVEILQEVPSYFIDTYLLWPQTPHLPLRVRLAIEALTTDLPQRVKN